VAISNNSILVGARYDGGKRRKPGAAHLFEMGDEVSLAGSRGAQAVAFRDRVVTSTRQTDRRRSKVRDCGLLKRRNGEALRAVVVQYAPVKGLFVSNLARLNAFVNITARRSDGTKQSCRIRYSAAGGVNVANLSQPVHIFLPESFLGTKPLHVQLKVQHFFPKTKKQRVIFKKGTFIKAGKQVSFASLVKGRCSTAKQCAALLAASHAPPQ
jgi:hypothetical protein